MLLAVCAGDRLVLRAVDADGAWRGGSRADGRLSGGGNGKIYGKGMDAARQRLRRFGRATGARTRSAVADCIVNTVSFVMESRYAYV